MKLFADECVYLATVQALRSWGHDVENTHEIGLDGQPDETILAHAQKERRILITADFDFSNIRNYPPKSYGGIIVLKIRPHSTEEVHATLNQLLEETSESDLWQSLVIVDKNKYRIR
jgi:predicted nuclease of predicted toxin-antitoxin system